MDLVALSRASRRPVLTPNEWSRRGEIVDDSFLTRQAAKLLNIRVVAVGRWRRSAAIYFRDGPASRYLRWQFTNAGRAIRGVWALVPAIGRGMRVSQVKLT